MATYILTTPDGRFVWGGPGMRPLARLAGGRLPTWETRADALRAALALKETINVELRPCLVRVPRK